MQVSFTMQGQDYSKNKAGFKKLLAQHGLKWKGDMRKAVWGSEKEFVTGVFVRDETRDVTLSATLTWQGRKKTPFLAEFEKWVGQFKPERREDTGADSGNDTAAGQIGSLNGEMNEDSSPGSKKPDLGGMIEDELRVWDMTHKPDIERLRANGRPDAWIKKDVAEWMKERKKMETKLKKEKEHL
jgi:hypothetical protein